MVSQDGDFRMYLDHNTAAWGWWGELPMYAVSLLTPWVAYVLAESIHVPGVENHPSGVLAVVVAGLLLGAAIVAGSGVEGAVVAYQVGWVFFLAPYGILAQPIHTTALPELATQETQGDRDSFAASFYSCPLSALEREQHHVIANWR